MANYNNNDNYNNYDIQSDNQMTVEAYRPIVTFILVGINVLIFIMETISGGSDKTEVLIKYGAQYAPYIFNRGEWYRIFTSMFLHIGVNHIASNMICLLAVGQYIENYFGRIRYIVIYIISGLCGNLLSLFFDMYSQNPAVSAGASGAISGLIGTLIILAIDPETRKVFPLPRVLIAIVLLMIPAASNVNILAHLGGLIGGLATGYCMYYYMRKH